MTIHSHVKAEAGEKDAAEESDCVVVASYLLTDMPFLSGVF